MLYCEDDETLDHVFGHSVVKVTVTDHHCKTELKEALQQFLQPQNTTEYSTQQLQQIRDKLKSWITLHRIPVELKGDHLVVAGGSLEITPPYDSNSCLTDNPIILQRVQKLISNMPQHNHVS